MACGRPVATVHVDRISVSIQALEKNEKDVKKAVSEFHGMYELDLGNQKLFVFFAISTV